MTLTLSGCGAEAEEPSVPADTSTSTVATGYTLTDADKLKNLAVGETAVWRDYEVTVTSIDRSDGKLVAHIDVKAHTLDQSLGTECLLSFGMPPVSSSFDNDTIKVAANETVSGTLTFNDQYNAQSLFWNDKATEATWNLQLPAVQRTEGEQSEAPKTDEPKTEEPKAEEPKKDEAAEAQKQAVAALEAEMPSLFTNNTLYTFQSVDTSTATVTPAEGGGYEYVNDVTVLGGDGSTITTNVHLICEANGNCISMTVDGAFLF